MSWTSTSRTGTPARSASLRSSPASAAFAERRIPVEQWFEHDGRHERKEQCCERERGRRGRWPPARQRSGEPDQPEQRRGREDDVDADRLCPIGHPRGPPLRREAPAPLADETAPQSKRRPHGRRSGDHDRRVRRRPPPPRQRAGIERSARAAPDKRPEHARLDRNLSGRCPVQRPVVAASPRHLLLREEAQRLCPHQFRWRGNLVHASTLAPIDSEPCTGPVLALRPVAGEVAGSNRRGRAERRDGARTPLRRADL